MNKDNLKKKYLPTLFFNRGFTLVELMVVISIFVIITTIMIFNYSDFRSNISLQNLTDDIALSIRKAQGFAIGSRSVGQDNNKVFTNSYGMHFTIDEAPNNVLDGSYKSFIMFITSSADKKYINNGVGNCGDYVNNNCIELFNITSMNKIDKILVDGAEKNNPGASIDVVFSRPDTIAYFCYRNSNNNNNGSCDKTNISNISIVISNGLTGDKYKFKTISVQNTGQISTQ